MSKFGEGETIKQGWIIIDEPGKIPDLKRPPDQSEDGIDNFLVELQKYYPTSSFTVARLTWNDELWIESGAGRLEEKAAMDSLTPEDWAALDALHEDA